MSSGKTAFVLIFAFNVTNWTHWWIFWFVNCRYIQKTRDERKLQVVCLTETEWHLSNHQYLMNRTQQLNQISNKRRCHCQTGWNRFAPGFEIEHCLSTMRLLVQNCDRCLHKFFCLYSVQYQGLFFFIFFFKSYYQVYM